MRKRLSERLLALLMAGGLVVCATAVGALPVRRAEAKQGAGVKRGDGRRWEYCIVAKAYEVSSGTKSTGVVEVCYLRASGCRVVKINGASKSDATVKAISRLGAEGWEAVGLFPSPLDEGRDVPFFKRPAR